MATLNPIRSLASSTCWTMTAPSWPALAASRLVGAASASHTMRAPGGLVALGWR